MKNIAIPLRLQEASLLGEDGLIYASIELETSEGHSLDLSLCEGHHEGLPAAARRKLYAQARATAWQEAAKHLRRLTDQAERRAARLTRPATSLVIYLARADNAGIAAAVKKADRQRKASKRPASTWQDTRANCS